MSDTPRTDAYEFALLQFGIAPQEAETDNNGPILSMNRHARTLERELSACRRDLHAEEMGTANLNRCLVTKSAECQRLREALAGVVHLYDHYDQSVNGTAIVENARAALQEVTPHNCALEGCADD